MIYADKVVRDASYNCGLGKKMCKGVSVKDIYPWNKESRNNP